MSHCKPFANFGMSSLYTQCCFIKTRSMYFIHPFAMKRNKHLGEGVLTSEQ